ncbi:MAG: hypothetical protein KGJ06_09415, partial [Pseudomonadota bacterium]|nr:hypothetical protein [Pseudomonadota bacterium]
MRRPLSIQNTLWLTVSVLTLLIAGLVMQEVYVQWQQLQKIESLKEATLFSDKLFDATEKFSIERDVAFAMLHAPDDQAVASLRSRLKESRSYADNAFAATMEAAAQYTFPELTELKKNIEAHLAAIHALRIQVDHAMSLPHQQRSAALASQWYNEATALMTETQNLWTALIYHFTDINPIVTQHLRYRHFLRTIIDYSGRERAVIGRLLVENVSPTPEEAGQLLRWQGMIDLSWKTARLLAGQSGLFPAIEPDFRDAESQYMTMYDMVRDIFYLPVGNKAAFYPIGTDLWFELSAQSVDSLDTLKEASNKEMRRYIAQIENEGERTIALHLALLLLALGLCVYCFRIIRRRVIGPINAMVDALVNAMEGRPVSLVPVVHAQDEIGKLASVLDAFQRNVDEVRRTYAMLENYAHALERSNKELDDFAYIASHDLKEPLRGIHNHSRFLLEDNAGKLDPDSVNKLNRLVYLSQRMERLVNDLLYFSRLGRQELAIQSTDINAVIHDIENTLDVFLHERNARIVIPKPLPTIVCDKTRVTEAFRNLITNAVKYNDKPEKTVEIGFLDAYSLADGTMARHVFYVRDNGKGIASEFYEEVFRIFKRLQAGKDSEDGTGVGLTFVKKIVERHGGRIWLESEPNVGTTFYFTL